MEQKQFFLNDDWLKRILKSQFKQNFTFNEVLHIWIKIGNPYKKKYDDPFPNKINYIVILNDVKEFWEKNDTKKRKNNIPYKKITVKEFLLFLLSVNKYYTYQTHFINLNFNIDKINKS